MTLENAYQILYGGALVWFALLIGLMLIRSAIGPRICDRILSINMIGTMVIASIAVLSCLFNESYLTDIAVIYALISFVTVLIYARSSIPKNPDRQAFQPEDTAGNDFSNEGIMNDSRVLREAGKESQGGPLPDGPMSPLSGSAQPSQGDGGEERRWGQ
ncbi:MAG: hypothetical protein K5989_06135 [Lachnospiraceae bacterium]|nr:hypothetical protein [Lachnospiraceae bacterium]